jgi:hypothetical protein
MGEVFYLNSRTGIGGGPAASLGTLRRLTGMSPGEFAAAVADEAGEPVPASVYMAYEDGETPPAVILSAAHRVAARADDPVIQLRECRAGALYEAEADQSRLLATDGDDDLLRRSLLLGSAFSAAAIVAPELLGPATDPARRYIGHAEVSAVQEMARQFRSMDRSLGGGRVLPLLADYLTSTVHGLLRHGCSDQKTRTALFVAAADLTRLAGAMAFDSGDQNADRYLMQAISLAQLAGDKAFSADILVTLGNQLVHLGGLKRDNADPAAYGGAIIDLAAAGLSATSRCGTPTAAAILHVLNARGHALSGDERMTARSLLAAERSLEHADLADEPSWIHGFDHIQLASDAMRCYRDLGRAREAIAFFEEASCAPGTHTRSRCLTQLTLASVRVQQKEIGEACRNAREALSLVGAVRSVRVRDSVQSLRKELSPFSGRDVQQFDRAACQALLLMQK